MLTNNLRLYFHGNFFFIVLLLHPVMPRGILLLLPSPSCFDVHVVVYLCELEGKKESMQHGSVC